MKWLTLLGRPNGLPYSRFSCTVRRTACPLAVRRNQMKRWLREAFRLNQEKFPRGIDWMAMVVAPPEERSFKETEKTLLGLAQQPEPFSKRSRPTR